MLAARVENPVRSASSKDARKFERPRDSEQGPICVSPGMVEVYNLVDRVANEAIPVLIQGETGTGKEVIARAIHERSRRAERPFCSLNCGAIPATLVESALFGHEKGAFSGASQRTKGVFEAADEGTVFLDEIGELSSAAQVALLRVLETKRVTRVGGSQEVATNVRVVAATHRDLEEMCQEGTFRLDLLFRLNTMVITVPPLRDRLEEIGALSEHFIALANRDNERQVAGVSPAVLTALRRHHWPGNVRELRNVIDRAVVICRGETIELQDLPGPIVSLCGSLAGGVHAGPGRINNVHDDHTGDGSDDGGVDFKTQVQQFEARLIAAALHECGFNKTATARRLQVPIRTLANKILAYELDGRRESGG
jgi:DNA-binding NtrC family response regulator